MRYYFELIAAASLACEGLSGIKLQFWDLTNFRRQPSMSRLPLTAMVCNCADLCRYIKLFRITERQSRTSIEMWIPRDCRRRWSWPSILSTVGRSDR